MKQKPQGKFYGESIVDIVRDIDIAKDMIMDIRREADRMGYNLVPKKLYKGKQGNTRKLYSFGS